MFEGLAVWALFIYVLRKLGMPWNLGTQIFTFGGGGAWLVFVWVGMIAWAPMDMTGGALVQSPHVQLRPVSPDVVGEMTKLNVSPNDKVKKGDVVFEIDDTQFQNKLSQSKNEHLVSIENLKTSLQNLDITKKLFDTSLLEIENLKSQISNKKLEINFADKNYERLVIQNKAVKGTVAEADLDYALTTLNVKQGELTNLEINLEKAKVNVEKANVDIEKAEIAVTQSKQNIENLTKSIELLEWKIEAARVKAPSDGFVTNFVVREGQFIGRVPRMYMYTEEKYVLLVINHQGLRNIKPGQYSEFSTPIYPGKVFKGKVHSVIEATGEAQGSINTREDNVIRTVAGKRKGRFHFVRVELEEPEGYDIPLGSYGIGWVSAEKPHEALGFLDVIRGIIIRIKAQIFFVYSL